VLEAMAMARPVVATSAAAEGIAHDETIRIADNADGFARAVCALIADPQSAATLGARARQRTIERYGWDARLAALDPLMGFSAPSRRCRSAA
jgi:glycosyltransferase involved in cell wall biosynthesis